MKKSKLISILIIAIMLLVVVCPVATFASESDTVTIEFEDEEWATFIYNSPLLGNNDPTVILKGKTITAPREKIESVTSITCTGCELKSIAGIENFINLEVLAIPNGGTDISDITPASKIAKLKTLVLYGSQVDSLESLENSTNISHLRVTDSKLTSLKGIEKMKLEIAHFYNNYINDITPLLNSKDTLTNVVIFNNQITSLDGLLDGTSLTSVYADNNNISTLGKISSNITNLGLQEQTVTQPVSLKDADEEVTAELPEILTALTDKNSVLYQGAASDIFSVENGTVSADGKTITAKVSDIKAGNVKITVTAGKDSPISAYGTVVTFVEAFEVLDVTKDPDTEDADKVTVTITVNKEIDEKNVPSGWTLSSDKKSISKEFSKNETEDVTIVSADGTTITEKVEVTNIKETESDNESEENNQENGESGDSEKNEELGSEQNNENGNNVTGQDSTTANKIIPNTGVRNTIIAVIMIIAITETVIFIKSRKKFKF